LILQFFYIKAISILGFSQEMYKYGTLYWFIGISYFITQPFAAHVYVPLFHRLKLTSAYQVFNLVYLLIKSKLFLTYKNKHIVFRTQI
jgi:hypothetical protein